MNTITVVGLGLCAIGVAGSTTKCDGEPIAPVWHVEGEARGAPAADSSTAYFLSRRHEVVAVSAETGALRWRQVTGEPGDETFGSRVLVVGSTTIVGDYNIIAFDSVTGTLRWRFAPDHGYGPGLYLGNAVGDLVYAGSPAGVLYAIDSRSGSLAWSAVLSRAGKTTIFEPLSDSDLVAVGYTTFAAPARGGVVALDRRSGRERWRAEFPRADESISTGFAGGLVLVDDMVVASSGDGIIYAFDRSTGTIRWTLPPVSRADGREQDRDWRPLARAGRLLIAGSLSGKLVAHDLDSKAERWFYLHPEGGSIAAQLVADNDAVYVPHFGGLLVCVGLDDGRQRWEIGGSGAGFSWAPAFARERLFVSSTRRGFFALPRATSR